MLTNLPLKTLSASCGFFLLLACDVPSAQINEMSSATAIQTGQALYQTHCASCHGTPSQPGQTPDLFDDEWVHGGSDQAILKVINEGLLDAGMPAFGDTLADGYKDNIISYLRNSREEKMPVPITDVPMEQGDVLVENWVQGLDEPWGLAFTGEQSAIVTEKKGTLRIIQNGELLDDPVKGTPEVSDRGQGGLMDVALDPDFATNGWVYLSFSHRNETGAVMTKIIRGRIKDHIWADQQTLFEAKPEHYNKTRYHFGSRITFDNGGHLFFSIGDRGKKDEAQDLTRPNGKIHRIKRDGTIPPDNPFIDREGAYPSLYAYGNRNPQGLIVHPMTGVLWETEHGPKGGDELNVIRSGVNYGWPEISYGRNYNGTELTPYTAKPGMAQPASHWTPSIAVCGLDVYTGDLFEGWKGKLLVGSLANQSVRLVSVKDETYVSEITILKDEGRVRDVTTGPDGAIYVALPKKIIRLTPKKK